MEEFVVSEVVTKEYLDAKLAQLEARLDGKLVQLDAKLDAKLLQFDAKFTELELRLIRWLVSTVGAAAIGIVVTVLIRGVR
jgi:hypothetical protein